MADHTITVTLADLPQVLDALDKAAAEIDRLQAEVVALTGALDDPTGDDVRAVEARPTSSRWHQIARSLADKEYRDLFVTEEINTGIPFQIRAMRQARGWSQKDLAAHAGMTQEGVSRLENPDYGKPTLTTLRRLAAAFDVGLEVRFVPFSRLVDWAVHFRPEDLAVPDYEHDPSLHADPSVTN